MFIRENSQLILLMVMALVAIAFNMMTFPAKYDENKKVFNFILGIVMLILAVYVALTVVFVKA